MKDLKGHSDRTLFAGFSFKKVLIGLNTNCTKFELSLIPFPRYENLDFAYESFLPLRNFARIAYYKQNFKKLLHACNSQSGAYLGGGPLGHGPTLWVARIAKLHRKVSKIEACPPPL